MKNIEQNSISINKIKNIKINKNTLKILNECNDIIYFTKIPIKSLFRKTDLITEVYQVKLQETVRNFECPICFEILVEPVLIIILKNLKKKNVHLDINLKLMNLLKLILKI